MTTADDDFVELGFADPVFDSQKAFRSTLEAMSRPGTVITVVEPHFVSPPDLDPAAAALLLTLADGDTPIYLPPRLRARSLPHWLAFQCGAPVTEDPAQARFAIVDGRAEDVRFADFNLGDDRYPDRSATLIVLCDALDGGPMVTLRGPGIRDVVQANPVGLSTAFWAEIESNQRIFPLGVDCLLVAGTQVLALPRTTHVSVGGR